MGKGWVRWLAFAVLAMTVLVSSCQALAAVPAIETPAERSL